MYEDEDANLHETLMNHLLEDLDLNDESDNGGREIYCTNGQICSGEFSLIVFFFPNEAQVVDNSCHCVIDFGTVFFIFYR